MSTDANFEREFQKFEQEMQHDAHELDEARAELKHIEEEEAAAKIAVAQNQKTISVDESKRLMLKEKVRRLERTQVERHAKVEALSRANRNRLEEHGADLKPKYK